MTDNNKAFHEATNYIKSAFIPALNGTKLCGVPGVCSQTAETKCSNVSLYNCSECSAVASGMFIFVVVLLGLSIIFGNGLIIKVYIDLKRKRKTTKVDLVKVSLAVADMIAGALIFFVAFPNFASTINSTMEKLLTKVQLSKNSASSIACGFFYLLGFTASLYHLMLLGMMRLYAIMRPQQYNQMSNHKPIIALAVTWILACVVTSIPAWFPEFFSYQYNAVMFFYLPSLQNMTSSKEYLSGIITLLFFVAIPYIVMTVFIISTGVLVRNQLRTSSKRLHASKKRKAYARQEASASKTLALMQFGFTITIIPFGVVSALLYAGSLTCETLTTPVIICFYMSLSNSLVNVLIYSTREKKFRQRASLTLRNFIRFLCCCNRTSKSDISSATAAGSNITKITTTRT